MGARGRQIVQEEFSLERVVRDTMAVYDKLREPDRTSAAPVPVSGCWWQTIR